MPRLPHLKKVQFRAKKSFRSNVSKPRRSRRLMVLGGGLEPPRVAPQAPQACVYADFTTRANQCKYITPFTEIMQAFFLRRLSSEKSSELFAQKNRAAGNCNCQEAHCPKSQCGCKETADSDKLEHLKDCLCDRVEVYLLC